MQPVSDRRTIRIFISSPSDVRPERLKAEQIIARLDREFACHFRVEAVLWEREPLVATHHFQDKRNIPQPRLADIVVVILWSQLGVALPEDQFLGAISGRRVTGTEWEFEDALASARERGVPDLLLYRKMAEPEARGSSEALRRRAAQLDLVEDFIGRWFRAKQGEGFTAASRSFATITEFEEQLYDHLRESLERRAGARAEGVEIRWHEAPFRGLLPFEFEHAPVFFGRTRARNDLRELLARQEARGTAFVLVLGASGSGKSSLVKAGLLPDLMLHGLIGRVALVRYALFRPSDAPADLVDALAAALLTATALPELAAMHYPLQELAALLREAPARTVTPIRQGLGEAARIAEPPLVEQAEARLVIIVDQLEELFTLDRIDAAERDAFVAALDALARSGLVWIFATMRSDFYDRLELMPSLARLAADEGRYNLLPPDDAELSQIIRQPALEAGLRFAIDPHVGVSLDAAILQAATKDRGALPLLSFLLDQLWQRRTAHGELTFEAYQELGRLEGALGRRAEEVFAALPENVRAALPLLLRELVTVGQGAQAAVATRPALLRGFPEGSVGRRLIDAFVAPEARLLVADEGEAGEARIRITHEALLTHWPRAAEHIAQDRNDLRIRTMVEAAEAEWRVSGTQRAYLLRDPLLTNAIDLARRWREELAANLREFVARSAAAAKAAVRRRWTIAAAVMLLLVGLAVASIGALFVAEQQRNDALISQSRFLARDSHAATASGDAVLGALLALAALPPESGGPERPLVQSAAGALEDAVANRREQLVLHGSAGRVTSAAFSPDSTQVVTASNDNTAQLWAARTGDLLVTLRGHEGEISSVAFSPDGTRVLTASSDKTARLWDAHTGALLVTLSDFFGVAFAALSPDGTRVATTSGLYGTLWDAHTGADIVSLAGHFLGVNSLAFSPDGTRVLASYRDNTALLWDARTGAALATLDPGHSLLHLPSRVTFAAFSPDGTQVVTTSSDSTARLWDARTGDLLITLSGHEDSVNCAAFSPDGTRVVTASSDNTARLWDAHNGTSMVTLLGHENAVNSVAFSADGTRVVTASDDNTARLWDARTGGTSIGALIATLRGHENRVISAAFSPDGTRVVTASDDNTARVWDARFSGTHVVLAHKSSLHSAVFSRDGMQVLTVPAYNEVRVWDARTGTALATLRHEYTAPEAISLPDGTPLLLEGRGNTAVQAAFSPDGMQVLTTEMDNTARLWDIRFGVIVVSLRYEPGIEPATPAAFSPDGTQILTTNHDNTAWLWDARTGDPLITLHYEPGIESAAFSPDGTQILTTNLDNTARLWDARTGDPLITLRGHALTGLSPPFFLLAAFSPDGTRVLTTDMDNTARLWDARTGDPLITLRGHEKVITSAAFSPDGARVVTASEDNTARLWDARTGDPLAVLRGHGLTDSSTGFSLSVAFSPDGTQVLTASSDKTARLWDARTGDPLITLRHELGVSSAAFSPDGARVLTASYDTSARIWQLPPHCQALIDAVTAPGPMGMPRELSPEQRKKYFLENRPLGPFMTFYSVIRPAIAWLLPVAGDRCE